MPAPSQQLINEARNFMERLESEHPGASDIPGLIEKVVEEMRSLNIYRDDAKSENFYAAFLSAKANGHIVLPKTEAELKAEQALADLRSREKYEKDTLRLQMSGRVNHAAKDEDTRMAPSTVIKQMLEQRAEQQAKHECETMWVVNRFGKPDHTFNRQLKECFAKKGGDISWVETWKLRREMLKGYELKKQLN